MKLHTTIKKYRSSHIVRNFLTLFSSNVISQFLALIIYPIVTRFYSPSDFGSFSLFLSIAGVLTILSTIRYESAILLPRRHNDAAALFDLTVISNIFVNLIAFLIILNFRTQIVHLLNAPKLSEWLLLLPLYVLTSGFWQSWNHWLNRTQKYSKIATFNITQSSATSSLKLFFGYINFSGGLILASVSGSLIALIYNILHKRTDLIHLFRFNKKRMLKVGFEQKNFPLFTLPHAVINYLGGNLPILLLAPFFPSSLIGYFGLTMAIAFTPITLLTSAMYQVLFQHLNEKRLHKDPIYPFIKQYLTKIVFLFLPFFVLLFFFAPMIIHVLLGSKWIEVGNYIVILLPWFFLTLITSPLSFISALFQKQKIAMWIEGTYTIARTGALFLGIFQKNFHLALLLFSITSSLFIFGQLCWFIHLARCHERITMQST